MDEKLNLLLSDPQVKPDEKLIFSIIGEKKILWQELMNYLKINYPDASGDWNYYNDGKLWLFKMTRKKKTIFWGTLLEDTFKITFYFGDKAEPVILESSLTDEVKQNFMTGKRYGKIRAISVKVNDVSDLEIIKTTIGIKVKLK